MGPRAVGFAIGFVFVTFVGSVLNSCGAGDHGPNPGAERGFAAMALANRPPSARYLCSCNSFPQSGPGGLLTGLGRSRLFFAAGVGVCVLSTALIWALEP